MTGVAHIPKRDGSERLILAPKKRLKALQRILLKVLVDKLPVSGHAHGFRTGRSIRSNAEPHVGRRVVVKMDIKDFFPSVHVGRVRGLLMGSPDWPAASATPTRAMQTISPSRATTTRRRRA